MNTKLFESERGQGLLGFLLFVFCIAVIVYVLCYAAGTQGVSITPNDLWQAILNIGDTATHAMH